MASGPIISWQIGGEIVESVDDFRFFAKSLQMMIAVMKLKDGLAPWKESYDKHRQHIKKSDSFTLQLCIDFAIHWLESTMGVHVFPILNPSPSPSHPSGSSQCTSSEHPVSCIEPSLAIHFTYDNLHISMPFSHIILPSPSPTQSKI